MYKKNKLLIFMLAIMSLSATVANAQYDGGKCGLDLSWFYDSTTGKLDISTDFQGYMHYEGEAPWHYYRNNIISVSFEGDVRSIRDGAFAQCSRLTSVVIPNSVESIGFGVFADCTGLTSVTIGSSVTSIGDYAFVGCTALTHVINNQYEPQVIDTYVFSPETYANATLYVPVSSYSEYITATGWQNFNNIQPIENLVDMKVSEEDIMVVQIVSYYSLSGQKLPQEPQKGMYIILYDNGKTKKVIK